MATQWWSNDGQLLAALDEALRSAHDMPSSFVDDGRAAFVMHDLDAQLAALCYDSQREPVLTRTSEAASAEAADPDTAALRSLTFTAKRISMHIEVLRTELHGQVVPPQAAEIELRSSTGATVTTAADELGWFVIRPLPAGTFQLRCRTRDGSAVRTGWITL